MKALIADHTVSSGLRLGEVPDPVRNSNEMLVRVTASSLNYGEVRRAQSGAADGAVLGWDAAGVVEEAPDGALFRKGDRVLTRGADGGWGQLRVVDPGECARIPDSVSDADAAALPVAAGTALLALRDAGSLLGRTVLVTGASGGVGRFGVQLAALGGAHVIASVGSEHRKEGLLECGADEVVVGLEGVTGVDVVLDTVGGMQLVRICSLLRERGVVECIGWTSQENAVFPPYSLVGLPRSIRPFVMHQGLGADLAYLLQLVREGSLKAEVDWHKSWSSADEAVRLLFGRKLRGKAVIDCD